MSTFEQATEILPLATWDGEQFVIGQVTAAREADSVPTMPYRSLTRHASGWEVHLDVQLQYEAICLP